MGWFSRLFSGGEANHANAIPPKDPSEDPKLDEAFEYGRKVAQSIDADMERFIAIRFGHIKASYLDILDGNCRDALSRTDHSPLIVARVDLSLFNDNVGETRTRMFGEIMTNMAEWSETVHSLGMDGDIERLAHSKLDAWQVDMQLAGITKLVDHADDLEAADKSWRTANPEQAKLEPLD